MSDSMPWGALAFMVVLYTFLGAAFTGGMITADPNASILGILDWVAPDDPALAVDDGGWSWVPLVGGFIDGLLGATGAALWGVLGIIDLVWNIMTFNIVDLPDFFRLPVLMITLPMLAWIVLCFAHKIKATINPLGG